MAVFSRQVTYLSPLTQVAVFAGADPERMMKDTQASKNRYQTGAEEFVLHKPLYHLHTYTDAQVRPH